MTNQKIKAIIYYIKKRINQINLSKKLMCMFDFDYYISHNFH
jgi:hypothetical protein